MTAGLHARGAARPTQQLGVLLGRAAGASCCNLGSSGALSSPGQPHCCQHRAQRHAPAGQLQQAAQQLLVASPLGAGILCILGFVHREVHHHQVGILQAPRKQEADECLKKAVSAVGG